MKPAPAPFIEIRRTEHGYQVRGQHACALGHRIEGDPQSPPDGVFASWKWDGVRLVVDTDRFGFQPLFYSCTDHVIRMSPSLIALLSQGASRQLDPAALSVFFRLGFFLGEDTPFKSIRTVPPGVGFTWTNGELSCSSQISLGKTEPRTRDAAVEGYLHLFSQAIQRRLPLDGNCVVPLTGGRDSRHILLELLQQGVRPTFCVTSHQYPPRASVDVNAARNICTRLGLDHVEVMPLSRTRAELEKNYLTHLCSDEHAWLMGVAHRLAAATDTTYDGTGAGDVISAGYFVRRYGNMDRLISEGQFKTAAQELLGDVTTGLESTLSPELSQGMGHDTAVRRLASELERFANAPNPVTMFFFWNRTRREVGLAPYGILRSVKDVYCPYLDHALFDFLNSLPAELLVDGNLHTDTIRIGYPAEADLPYSENWRRSRDVGHYAGFVAGFLNFAIRRNPTWLARNGSLPLLWVRCAGSRNYRRKNRMLLSPTRLLYGLDLEQLALGDGPATSADGARIRTWW